MPINEKMKSAFNKFCSQSKEKIVLTVLAIGLCLVFWRAILASLIMFLLLPIIGCFAFLSTYENNITRNQEVQHVVGRCYTLTQDVFLYTTYAGEGAPLNIEGPGRSSLLPISIEDYYQYGQNWDKSPAYKKEWKEFDSAKFTVKGVLTRGTNLKVVKIIQKGNFESGNHFYTYVEILEGPLKGKVAHILEINSKWGKGAESIEADPKYLQECEAK